LPSKREQFKAAMKVWSAMSKFLRSQCNKGRIVDSLYFGTFGKASTIQSRGGERDNDYGDTDYDDDHYFYCPGPKSIFNIAENRENVTTIP